MMPIIRRTLKAALFGSALTAAVLTPVAAADAANAAGQQELVDRATLALNEVLGSTEAGNAREMLPNARAVMICPRVFRGGFFFGAEGGSCVLVARGAQGSWSAPAFYDAGGGSFGFQFGIQDAAVVMMIMRQGALRAVLDSQIRLGADASVALITVGAGIEGATTAALNADIVAVAKTRGLFAGIALQGSVMSSDSAGDEAYYGQPVGPVDIVMAMRVNNPGADPLRAALMRYSSNAPQAYAAAPAYSSPPEATLAPVQPVYPVGGPAPVQEQSLPPPR
jgi:lipid-binding SYLF domain-containing protein